MTLLTPLGFLGLLGIGLLILIYVLKPNYQQRFVSSTYIWKLSFKFRKKKLPVSKLRNVLLIICQFLIVALCAFLLTQPIHKAYSPVQETENIAIIDASGSMQVSNGDETRFERAVEQVRLLAYDTFDEGGSITVILAGTDAETILYTITEDDAELMEETLDALIDEERCTYGNADIDGAISLAQEALDANPYAQVKFYTATSYIETNGIEVVDVSDEKNEWNAAILGLTATVDDTTGYYELEIQVASYGKSATVELEMEIHGANGGSDTKNFKTQTINCVAGKTQTITINTGEGATATPQESPPEVTNGLRISSFQYIYAYLVNTGDNISEDDGFYLYGGELESVDIQYYFESTDTRSSCITDVILALQDSFYGVTDITVSEARQSMNNAKLTGYDLYIYQDNFPSTIPTDGVVLLLNPSGTFDNLGVSFGGTVGDGSTKMYASHAAVENELLTDLTDGRFFVTKYRRTLYYSEDFVPIMYYGEDPLILVKNTETAKVVILNFSFSYSDFGLTEDFFYFMYNIIEYYIPNTLSSGVCDVSDTITISSRGAGIAITDSNGDQTEYTFAELPMEYTAYYPGTYTVKLNLMSGQTKTYNFFAKMPAQQSNIFREEDSLPALNIESPYQEDDDDLAVYFAAALLAVLFLEWWLQARENY